MLTLGHRTGPASGRPWTGKTHRSAVRQFAGFAAVGMACALLFAAMFVLLRSAGVPALAANIGATLTTTVISSAAHRRVSFGVRGPAARLRHLGQGGLLMTATLAINSTVFVPLALFGVTLTTGEELVVANIIGLVTGIIRFLLLRHWVYRPHSPRADATDRGAHDPTAELRQTAVPRHQRKGLPCRPTSIDRPLTCPLIQTWL